MQLTLNFYQLQQERHLVKCELCCIKLMAGHMVCALQWYFPEFVLLF